MIPKKDISTIFVKASWTKDLVKVSMTVLTHYKIQLNLAPYYFFYIEILRSVY